MKRKKVAVGISKLLYFALKNIPQIDFDYVLDRSTDRESFEGLKVRDYSFIENEDIENTDFYIFAVSNHSILAIKNRLKEYGVNIDSHIFIYSDLFAPSFSEKIQNFFNKEPSLSNYTLSLRETLQSQLSVHTTICGTWLFLEALEQTKDIEGHIAEVGCYEGGNALIALKNGYIPRNKNFYLFDSFEGFPQLSEHDPSHLNVGDYKPQKTLKEIKQYFESFSNVSIIPGYVPETFSQLPNDEKYSLVFFDCDLYQPCMDTLEYFWGKMAQGGIILIHDYFYEEGGFFGVEKATLEFCKAKGLVPTGIWESTMAILKKGKY